MESLSRGWRPWIIIAALALACVAPGLARIPVTDRDEARYAQATRQMLETGDFVQIRVQEQPRNKKPIGIHWMQAAAVAAAEPITGGVNTIWAYRLPSALGALIAALATFWGGAPLVGRRAAFLGACLFAASFLLTTEGIIAKTDAMLCGVTTLAMAALARLRERVGFGKALALLFWVAVGLGALVKGPVTPLVAGLTLATLALWERRLRWMAPLAQWLGPILAALIVMPWFVAIEIATGGDFLRDAFFGDLAPKMMGGAEGHAGPPGYHLALLALSLFPATLGLIPGAALAWSALRAPPNDSAQAGLRFLVAWAAPTWIVFEIVSTKLPHYVLPTFPALALLAGAGLVAAEQRRWRITPALSIVLFGVGAAGLVALCAYFVMFLPGDAAAAQRRAAQAAIVGGAGALVALGALFFVSKASLRTAIAVIVAIVATWTIRERVLPETRTLFVSAEAASALRRANLLGRAPIVIGYRETSVVFETRTDAQLLPIGEDAFVTVQVAEPGTPVLMDCSFANVAQFRFWSFRPVGPDIEGVNYANGDHVCLRPGVAGRAMTLQERTQFLERMSRGVPAPAYTAPHP